MKRTHAALLLLILSMLSKHASATPCEAYFPFDGNLDDASGYGNHGLMIAGEGDPQEPQFLEGKVGQSLHITEGNAMRAFIDLHHEFCPQVTVTAWFRMPSADLNDAQYVFATGAGNGPGVYAANRGVHMRATGNGIVQRDAIRDTSAWWFVAAVYDHEAGETGTYELHWRSRVVTGVISANPQPPADSFWIGAYNDRLSQGARDLYIDEVRIHPAALTREQIEALAANPGAPGPSSSASTLSTAVPGIDLVNRTVPTPQQTLKLQPTQVDPNLE